MALSIPTFIIYIPKRAKDRRWRSQVPPLGPDGREPVGDVHVRWMNSQDDEQVDAVLRLRDELTPAGSVDRRIIERRLKKHPSW
jgi:hypothetical protein